MIFCWRPVWESNPCRRHEREATCCNSMELSGVDSTLQHLEDSRGRLLDAEWTCGIGNHTHLCLFGSGLFPLAYEHERRPVKGRAIFFAGDHRELRFANRLGRRRVWPKQAPVKVGH